MKNKNFKIDKIFYFFQKYFYSIIKYLLVLLINKIFLLFIKNKIINKNINIKNN